MNDGSAKGYLCLKHQCYGMSKMVRRLDVMSPSPCVLCAYVVHKIEIVRGSETFFSIFSPLEDASKRDEMMMLCKLDTRCKPTADGSDMQEDDDGMISLHSLTHSRRFEIQHRQYY